MQLTQSLRKIKCVLEGKCSYTAKYNDYKVTVIKKSVAYHKDEHKDQ